MTVSTGIAGSIQKGNYPIFEDHFTHKLLAFPAISRVRIVASEVLLKMYAGSVVT